MTKRATSGAGNYHLPVFLLCGPNLHKQKKFITGMTEQLTAAVPDMHRVKFYGFEHDAGTVLSECNSYSLLTRLTLVYVLGAERVFFKASGSEQLLAYLADPNPDTVLVLQTSEPNKPRMIPPKVIAAIRKVGKVVECSVSARDQEREIRDWFARAGVRAEPSAVRRLAELTEYDQDGLTWCLEHLRDNAVAGTVTQKDVIRALAGEGGGNLWGFLDHLGERSLEALADLQLLLGSEDMLRLLWHVRKRVRDLTIFKEMQAAGRTEDMIAKTLRLKSWALGRLQRQAKRYSLPELRCGLGTLTELDYRLKSTGSRQHTIRMEKWLADFITAPGAAHGAGRS